MYPDITSPTSFKYPSDWLLPFQGVIPEDELCSPKMCDINGEPCLIVIKNGHTSGTTIGHATGIKSIVRKHFQDRNEMSMEWAILGDHKAGVFSDPGDSGAIIVDGRGHIGGSLLLVPARWTPPMSHMQLPFTGSWRSV
ncbi:hypothetical protein EDB85DRAFT_1884161 [Lactarius pseudohatsudake]|nr:hypothetical protein EDB85DRAFT_1884161 [Lactarius pseudohatsudake]